MQLNNDASAPTVADEAQRRCFISHRHRWSLTAMIPLLASPMKLNSNALAPSVADKAQQWRFSSPIATVTD